MGILITKENSMKQLINYLLISLDSIAEEDLLKSFTHDEIEDFESDITDILIKFRNYRLENSCCSLGELGWNV